MEENILKGLNFVLLGKSKAGISASGNTILGRQAFTSKKSSTSVTQDVAVESGAVGNLKVTVYDTPGLFNTHMDEEEIQHMINEKVLQKCESGLCAFLLVIKVDSFTEEERKTVEKIEKLLGEKHLEKTWILFTRGDELEEENTTIQEFINGNKALKKLVQKYDHRYHVFNNKTKKHPEQVQTLLIKVLKPYFETLEEVPEILKPNPLMRKKPENVPDAPVRGAEEVPEGLRPKIKENVEPAAHVSGLSSRRIVLLGKSGVGKSAAGNTILGQKEFVSVMRMNSVTSECLNAHTTVSGRSVSVVDTPGLFDTKITHEEIMTEIARSVYLSSPGPHAFIIVFPVNMRFTEHEQQIPQIIEMMFGQEVLKYSIILFTHGDLLDGESVENLIEENCKLRDLIQQCGGRYHVFNNKDQDNREQVNDLLQKIDSMIEHNGGGHYSNQMFEDALRFRQEEEEQRKQLEAKKVQEEIERVRKDTEEKIRAEMESEEEQRKQEKQRQERIRAERETTNQSGFSRFFSKYKSHFQMAAFVVGGITLGALVLTVVGAAVGAGVGATVTAVSSGGATVSCSFAGASLSASVGAAAATGAAATGAVATGAGIGAVAGAVAGGVVGGVAGAFAGVSASKDVS